MELSLEAKQRLVTGAKCRARRLDIGEAAAKEQLRRSPANIREEAVALRLVASDLEELAEDVEAGLAQEAAERQAREAAQAVDEDE